MLVYCILQVVLLSIIISLMNITGIVVEYNPFHNGHILHINKARELTNSNLIIACMSGNFTQRGEAAIINKWERTKMALKYGVDLVVELPFVFAVQSADVFAKASIYIILTNLSTARLSAVVPAFLLFPVGYCLLCEL